MVGQAKVEGVGEGLREGRSVGMLGLDLAGRWYQEKPGGGQDLDLVL